jgi:hypothetical protein
MAGQKSAHPRTTVSCRTAVATAFAVFIVAGVVTSASAQEYRVYGTVTAELLHAWSEAESANRLAVPLSASLAHSISGESFDLSARTVLSTPPSVASPGGPFAAQITVPQLSLTMYPATWLTARVGRFDLDWGTTLVFTPGNDLALAGAETGSFSDDPEAGAALSVTELTAGFVGDSSTAPGSVSGASISFIPGPTTTVGIAASLPAPRPTTSTNPWQEVTIAAWADALFGGIEGFVGFQYRSGSVLRPSLGVSLDVGGTIVAGEVAVEFAERYRYPTGALTFEPRPSAHPVTTISAQRTLSGNDLSLSLAAEYLFTDLGYSEAEAGRFYDLIATGFEPATDEADASDLAPLGRHYATAQVSLSWYSVAELSVGGVVNASDGSLAAGGELSIVALEALDVYLRSGLIRGEEGRSEFGLLGTYGATAIGVRLNL